MISIFLTVFKIIGIILLSLLLLLFVILLLILFVPVRYQVSSFRKEGEEAPVNAALKVTWLLHMITAAFRYPKEANIKIRLFGFSVFSSDKKQSGRKKADQKKPAGKNAQPEKAKEAHQETRETCDEKTQTDEKEENLEKELQEKVEAFEKEKRPKVSDFVKKLLLILKNIKYTICQIYDKIKHMIKNVRYYIRILKSDTFKRAWSQCGKEAISLLKSIRPRKLTADFVVGTGDPAGTAQILAIEGILYPLVGDHITITPDFEHSIIEGSFFVKGRITVWRLLMTAIRIYFNRDLRRIIRLFKKEAA